MSTYKDDVFGYKRNPKPVGVFSVDNSTMYFGTSSGSGDNMKANLVQNWNINYAQTVTEVFEIGSNNLYWVKGRPQGQGQIGRIVGSPDSKSPTGLFPPEAFDMCEGGAHLVLKARGGACKDGNKDTKQLSKGVNLSMSACVVTSIGYQMQVGDVKLLENFQFRFAALKAEHGKVGTSDPV